MTIGLITYDRYHAKSAVLAARLIAAGRDVVRVEVPFRPRAPRQPLIHHRPPQFIDGQGDTSYAALPQVAADEVLAGDGPQCEFYVVGGAGLLPAELVERHVVVNAHPGWLPDVRGLDAFKWALIEDQPLGVTVHIIDGRVDCGRLVAQASTAVQADDDLDSLAHRHYQHELDLLAATMLTFDPRGDYPSLEERGVAHRRMPAKLESTLIETFPAIKARRLAAQG